MITGKRRLFITLICIVFGFTFLLVRLFWIQAVTVASFSSREVDLVRRSVFQREKGIELDSGRGHFYDRSLNPITGERIQALVFFPIQDPQQRNSQKMEQLAKILHISIADLLAYMNQQKAPWVWKKADQKQPLSLTAKQEEAIIALQIPGVRVMPYQLRYPEQFAARHLIGFIGENPQRIQQHFAEGLNKGYLSLKTPIGAAGLEKTFDRLLHGAGSTSISFFTDGKHRSLSGLDARLVKPTNPFYPLKVVTAIDLPVQRRIEAFLDQSKFPQGAVVVLDVQNADVIAMASRPDFDPYHIDLHRGNWSNRALKEAVPGSVFKTVVAAAALEEKVVTPEEIFECTGVLGKYGFTCWLKQGHGKISFAEAYAVSCNITFAKVMQRLNADQLKTYADLLGLNREIGWAGPIHSGSGILRQFDGEDQGQLFASTTPREDEGVLVQTSIGQRDVRMTPLQAANMVVTLLNKGELVSPRVVQEIRYQNGQLMLSFPKHKLNNKKEQVSTETSLLLTRWMEQVVAQGTGRALQKADWKLAGKSGTAQVTPGVVHQWFTGYGPVEKPRYAVAVVAHNVSEYDSNRAIAVFRGVMDILASQQSTGK